MTYRIEGLPQAEFTALCAMSDDELAACNARRIVADAEDGFPCRVSLEHARVVKSVILLHYTSHDVPTPYRTGFAVFVREGAETAAPFIDCLPPVLETRAQSMRAYTTDGNMVKARLTAPAEVDATIRALFANPAVAYIHTHNAAYGCFAARIDRHQEEVR